MPRSSHHKSSKHSSREAREYSDSEKELNLKDQKESEKQKVDSTKDAKDLHGSGNGDYSEEHGSLKQRRERVGDGVSDRWNGGDFEFRLEDPVVISSLGSSSSSSSSKIRKKKEREKKCLPDFAGI
jgi:hypothetical protein